MKYCKTLFLSGTLLLCFACNGDKTDPVPKWIRPEFDTEHQSIIYKERLSYDVKSIIYVPSVLDNENRLGCMFSFYNYGDDLCLWRGCDDDGFARVGKLAFIATLNLDKDDITIMETHTNDKYGEWAIANVYFDKYSFNDVFVSPLAMKAYKEGEIYQFVFFQLVGDSKYLNAIYYGSSSDCRIIDHYSHLIVNGLTTNVDGPIKGPGPFWHELTNGY